MAAKPRQSDKGAERREHRRIPSRELPATPLVRIPSRGALSLVDLSSGGALLELPFQLQPRSRITLELQTPSEQLAVPFHLLRCWVADLKNGVRYRAAGAFEHAIALPSPHDGLLDGLEVFRRTSQFTDLCARGTYFNELLEWTIVALRRGEQANVASAKIEGHLRRLFPALAIGRTPLSSQETSTFVRFSDLGLKSHTPLASSERRFLKACAQLMRLLGTPRKFSVGQADEVVAVPAFNPSHPHIVHTVSDWMAISTR